MHYIEFHEAKNKKAVYYLGISALGLEIFMFKKCVKDVNEMTDGIIHSTQHYIKYIDKAILAKFQHRPLKFARLIVLQETHLYLHLLFPQQRTHSNSLSFSPHPIDFNVLLNFSSNIEQGHKLELTYLYASWIVHMRHH